MIGKNLEEIKQKKPTCCHKLKEFDQFGAQMKFNIKNNESHKTVLGSISCIFFSVVAIFYIILNFYYFAWRTNQTLIFSDKILPDSPPINFTQLKFNFGLGIMYDTNGKSAADNFKDYFEYTYNYVTWDGYDSTKTKIEKLITGCKKEDFFDTPKNNITSAFNHLQLTKSFCPSLKDLPGYEIRGVQGEKNFKYIEATIRIKADKINQTDKIIELMSKVKVKAIFYYLNSAMDYEDLDKPVSPIIETVDFYLDVNRYRKVYANLGVLQFSSDENIIYNSPTSSNATSMISFNTDFYDMKVRNPSVEDFQNLFRVYLVPSKKTVIYQRTYQKVTDYVANMTGVLSQILFIIIIVMTYVNNISARQAIMLRMMKVSGNKNFDRELLLMVFNDKLVKKYDETASKKFIRNRFAVQSKSETILSNYGGNHESRRNLFNNEEISNLNVDISNLNAEEKPAFHKNESETVKIDPFPKNESENVNIEPVALNNSPEVLKNEPKDFKKEPFSFNIENANSLKSVAKSVKSTKSHRAGFKYDKMNSCTILFYNCISCCKPNIKKKMDMVELGDKKVAHYLDVLTYIKKMNELDCMKFLFMNDDQQTFFNFISSPSLSDNLDSDLRRFYDSEYKRKFIFKKEEISKLLTTYERFTNIGMMNSIDLKLAQTFVSQVNSIKNEDY